MSTTIRSLVVKVGADLTDMQKGFKQASKDLKNIGKNFSAAGSTLTKGLTLPIIGAITGLTGLAVNAGKTADELITLSNKTGLSTKALQEMEYAAKFIDVPLETMTASMQKLIKSMDGAKKGTKDQVEAFNTLGVEYKNTDGSLRDSEAVWRDTIDALGNMSNETERNAMSLRLFGRSSQELNPLIVAGSEALNKLAQEARDLGLVLSDEDVKALGKFDDAREKFAAGIKIAGMQVGIAFLPVMEKIMPLIQEKVIPALTKFAGKLTDLIDKFLNAPPGVQKFIGIMGAVLIGIGPVFSMVGKLTTGLSGLMGGLSGASKAFGAGKGLLGALKVLMGPAGIALAVIGALAGAAYLIMKNWEGIKAFFDGIADAIKKAFDWYKKFADATQMGTSKGAEERNGFALPKKTNYSGIKELATGGIVTSPTLALVGEAGPEAVVPLNKGMGTISTNLYLDSVMVASATSKAQYGRNKVKARSLGVIA